MYKFTRQTRDGWKTYLYKKESDFQVGRPLKCRNSSMNEMQNANILVNEEKAEKTSENEGGAKDKWALTDFKDQIEDWKKAGFNDEKKLEGMINRATEIAKKSTESAPGKATRAEVLGILQGFFQKK